MPNDQRRNLTLLATLAIAMQLTNQSTAQRPTHQPGSYDTGRGQYRAPANCEYSQRATAEPPTLSPLTTTQYRTTAAPKSCAISRTATSDSRASCATADFQASRPTTTIARARTTAEPNNTHSYDARSLAPQNLNHETDHSRPITHRTRTGSTMGHCQSTPLRISRSLAIARSRPQPSQPLRRLIRRIRRR